MASERRKFVRVATRLNLSYKILNTQKLGKSLTKDISGGGVRFLAEHPLELGTPLEVILRLPECHEPIRFVGQVVWSAPCRSEDATLRGQVSEVGVQFVTIDPKDRALILQSAAFYSPPSGQGRKEAG